MHDFSPNQRDYYKRVQLHRVKQNTPVFVSQQLPYTRILLLIFNTRWRKSAFIDIITCLRLLGCLANPYWLGFGEATIGADESHCVHVQVHVLWNVDSGALRLVHTDKQMRCRCVLQCCAQWHV